MGEPVAALLALREQLDVLPLVDSEEGQGEAAVGVRERQQFFEPEHVAVVGAGRLDVAHVERDVREARDAAAAPAPCCAVTIGGALTPGRPTAAAAVVIDVVSSCPVSPFRPRDSGDGPPEREAEVVARVEEADVLDHGRERARSSGSSPRRTSSPSRLQSTRRKYSCRV